MVTMAMMTMMTKNDVLVEIYVGKYFHLKGMQLLM
jgi:hypothetical protein